MTILSSTRRHTLVISVPAGVNPSTAWLGSLLRVSRGISQGTVSIILIWGIDWGRSHLGLLAESFSFWLLNSHKLELEKAKEPEIKLPTYFCFIDHAKAFDCVDHNKLWKIFKETGIPDHLTCLLRNLYAGQEATVRTGLRTTDLFLTGKGECQSCILLHYLFNLYAEYIMRNDGLDEAQAGIKIAGGNISNSDMQMTPSLWQKVKKN